MLKKLTILVLLAGSVSACATVEGVGRDISGGANRVSGWFN
jgi:predicted small secreted protein